MDNNPVIVFPDGRREVVSFDKITSRIQKLCYGLNSDFVDPVSAKLYSIIHHCKDSVNINKPTLLLDVC